MKKKMHSFFFLMTAVFILLTIASPPAHSQANHFPLHSLRIKITSNVTVDNYPVMIRITDPTIISHIIDGNDIFFIDSNNNPLYYVVEYLNKSSNLLIAWVSVNLTEGDNYIAMYYSGANLYPEYHDPTKVFYYYHDFNDTGDWTLGPTCMVIENGFLKYDGNCMAQRAYSYVDDDINDDLLNTTIDFAVGAITIFPKGGDGNWSGLYFTLLYYNTTDDWEYSLELDLYGSPKNSDYPKGIYTKIDYYYDVYDYEKYYTDNVYEDDWNNKWYRFEIIIQQPEHYVLFYVDSYKLINTTRKLENITSFRSIGMWGYGGRTVWFDAVYVRKRVFPEPTVTILDETIVEIEYFDSIIINKQGYAIIVEPDYYNVSVVKRVFDPDEYFAPLVFINFMNHRLIVKRDVYVIEDRILETDYEPVYFPLGVKAEIYIYDWQIVIILTEVSVVEEKYTVHVNYTTPSFPDFSGVPPPSPSLSDPNTYVVAGILSLAFYLAIAVAMIRTGEPLPYAILGVSGFLMVLGYILGNYLIMSISSAGLIVGLGLIVLRRWVVGS